MEGASLIGRRTLKVQHPTFVLKEGTIHLKLIKIIIVNVENGGRTHEVRTYIPMCLYPHKKLLKHTHADS